MCFLSQKNGRRARLRLPFHDRRQLAYAALLTPLISLPSRGFSLPTLTLICLGLASVFLAILIFSTPLSELACTCAGSTVSRSVKAQAKVRCCRSTRR